MARTPASESLKEALTELATARDQARVKLHLLSLDAQQTWSDLERRIGELQSSAEREATRLADDSARTAHDLARTVREFVQRNL